MEIVTKLLFLALRILLWTGFWFGIISLLFLIPSVLYYIFITSPILAKAREISDRDDDDVRKGMLKQGFSESKVKDVKYDVLIIGSGIGGLSSAAMLSRLGYKVLVLEQHDIVGGEYVNDKDK